MSDFSFLKDSTGKTCSIWVHDAANAQDRIYLMTLLMRGGVSPDALAGYRVVPNRHDNQGGFFVMLGSALAPGE